MTSGRGGPQRSEDLSVDRMAGPAASGRGGPQRSEDRRTMP
jgi:hypothetical protein